jgi:excisionase family DNA binding protein
MDVGRMTTKQPKNDAAPHHQPLVLPLWPDTGKALGLSRNATYDAAKRGEIPTIRFGKLIKVPTAALHRMLEDAGQKPSGPNSD